LRVENNPLDWTTRWTSRSKLAIVRHVAGLTARSAKKRMFMTQDETNRVEWEDPENWSDGPGWLYFSKKDTRVWVPKRHAVGRTINLAREEGAKVLVNILVGIILAWGFSVMAVVGVFGYLMSHR
jgi:uncharacterized membrane protein